MAEGDVVWVPPRHVTPDSDHKIVQTKDGRIRLMRMLCPTSCHFYQVCISVYLSKIEGMLVCKRILDVSLLPKESLNSFVSFFATSLLFKVKFKPVSELEDSSYLGSNENLLDAAQHLLENPADIGISITEGISL